MSNKEGHSPEAKQAVYNSVQAQTDKVRPKNAAQSYSPYILASGFNIDIYALYRETVDTKSKKDEPGS